MDAIGIGRESLKSLSTQVKHKRGMGETKKRVLSWNEEWCNNYTLGKGSGWATNRLVNNPEGMPTRNQKWLVKP